MAETKTPNYTVEQTATMLQDYAAGVSVEMIAESMGKTVRSVVAKLSREGVYQKKTYVTKTGEAVQKKDSLADKIAALVGLTESETESLTKANKTALAKILTKVSLTV
jgi:response regulator RpfG family c-di-GMP phosphodiesterase